MRSFKKNRQAKGASFGALCLIVSQVAFPQNLDDPTYKKFVKDNIYMVGLYRGASGINAYLIAEKKAPLFCIPPEIATDERAIIKIVEDEISRPTYSKKYQYKDIGAPPDMVMASTLMEKFPCPIKEAK